MEDLTLDKSDDELDSSYPTTNNDNNDRLHDNGVVEQRGEPSKLRNGESLSATHSLNGESHTNNGESQRLGDGESLCWKDYLGSPEDPTTNILIRLEKACFLI